MHTLFEEKYTIREKISLEEVMNQHATVLPKREELSVINYNIGYPYTYGYDGSNASSHGYGHEIDKQWEDMEWNCFGRDSDRGFDNRSAIYDDWGYGTSWGTDFRSMPGAYDTNIIHNGAYADPVGYNSYSGYGGPYGYGNGYSYGTNGYSDGWYYV